MAEPRQAAALRYDRGPAPRVVASGRGPVAERILELAAESGIALREDPLLSQALASLELGQDVPPRLYAAVAEALVWAYRLSERPLPAP